MAAAAAIELALYRVAAAGVLFVIEAQLALAGGTSDRHQRLAEMAGRWEPAADERRSPVIWLHAASLGEVRIAAAVAHAMRLALANVYIVLSCNTPAGRRAANSVDVDEVRYFPVDHPRSLARVLSALRPALFVFVETEIWPLLLLELRARRVPAAMVNARVSSRSFPRYRRVRGAIGTALATLAAVGAREEASRQRLLALGAPAERTVVTGDIKLEALGDADVDAITDHSTMVSPDSPVLLAASTHAGEEEIVLEAFARVRRRHPEVRLIVAPRHTDRAQAVAALATRAGHATASWSGLAGRSGWDVLVVDTTGELRGFFKGAAGVFVGGSFGSIGGHNLIEPAVFARPVATGPSLESVEETAEALVAAGALTIVHDAGELAADWQRVLADPATAAARGAAGLAFVRSSGGALERTMALLAPLLEDLVGSSSQGLHDAAR